MVLAAACAPPAVIKRVEAAYPSSILADPKGIALSATIHVVISSDGTVAGDSLVHTTGIPDFDQAALDAVKQWKFAPPTDACAADESPTVIVAFAHGPNLPASYDPCTHDALLLNQVVPGFPDSARNLDHRERRVRMVVSLDARGQVTNISVAESSGNDALDRMSEMAAAQSRYAPKFVNCAAAAGTYTMTVTFDPNT